MNEERRVIVDEMRNLLVMKRKFEEIRRSS